MGLVYEPSSMPVLFCIKPGAKAELGQSLLQKLRPKLGQEPKTGIVN